jgi:hypothetical protein
MRAVLERETFLRRRFSAGDVFSGYQSVFSTSERLNSKSNAKYTIYFPSSCIWCMNLTDLANQIQKILHLKQSNRKDEKRFCEAGCETYRLDSALLDLAALNAKYLRRTCSHRESPLPPSPAYKPKSFGFLGQLVWFTRCWRERFVVIPIILSLCARCTCAIKCTISRQI